MRVLLSFIKKEFLLVLRNRQELLVLVAMPLILITILGFALSAFLDGEVSPITGEAALIMHTSEDEEFNIFMSELSKLQLPEEAKLQIEKQAEALLPITILQSEIFGDSQLQSVITLTELPVSQLQEAKEAEQYSAIIEVPEQFTSKMLKSLFIEETEVPALTVYSNESKELSAGIVEDVVKSFQEQFSLYAGLGREGFQMEEGTMLSANVSGTVETLTKKEPIGAFSYYTIGMSVMFVLFIAATVSSQTFLEKKRHVFDRILLTNVPRLTYVTSVFFSTFIIALFQLAILYTGAAVFYGVYWPDLVALLCVTLALCSAVAGFAVLLMAMNNRLGTDSSTKLFMSAFVPVIAFLGGSFTPVGSMSDWMVKIGELTPNGAALSAFMDVQQGAGVAEVTDHLSVLLILTVALFAVAILTFPRKAGAA